MPREIGLMFTDEMVRAILAGEKTQTRRIKFNGKAGDLIWVKESWAWSGDTAISEAERVRRGEVWYRANHFADPRGINWRNKMFMPRWASRILLRVVDIRQERLQSITTADALAEGVKYTRFWEQATASFDARIGYTRIFAFRLLWNSIHRGSRRGAADRGDGWDANPIVTVVTFERVHDKR